MGSHLDLIEKITALSESNKLLTTEAHRLGEYRDVLDSRVDLSRTSLGLAFKRLPALVGALASKQPPQARQSLPWFHNLGLPRFGLDASEDCGEDLQALSAAQTNRIAAALHSLSNVESTAKETKNQAVNCRLRAADLASRASRQKEECTTVSNSISTAMREIQMQIERTERDIPSTQSQLQTDMRPKDLAETKAADRDRRADKNGDLLIKTFLIPGVNLVTVPLSIGRMIRHLQKVEEYENLASFYSSSIIQETASLNALQTQNSRIKQSHMELDSAALSCSNIAERSTKLKQEAMQLVDQNGIIVRHSRAIADLLEMFGEGMRKWGRRDWDRARLGAIQAVAKLVEEVKEWGFLEENEVEAVEWSLENGMEDVLKALDVNKENGSSVIALAIQ